MSDNLTAVIIVLVCVLGPIWLTMHYGAKRRATQQLAAGDQAVLERAMQTAQTLESRVLALERILDVETPDWRRQYGETEERYGKVG